MPQGLQKIQDGWFGDWKMFGPGGAVDATSSASLISLVGENTPKMVCLDSGKHYLSKFTVVSEINYNNRNWTGLNLLYSEYLLSLLLLYPLE